MSDLFGNPEDRFSHVAAHLFFSDTITTVLLLVLLVLQICFIFGARRVYQRTKEMEKEIAKLKAKQ